jgi:hypothetical protein
MLSFIWALIITATEGPGNFNLSGKREFFFLK